jgi:zinc and cadmium transporter
MSTLAWVIAASVLGGVLSVSIAAIFALTTRAGWIPMLVSYAIGALLGAVFLDILPHAFEMTKNPEEIAVAILFGILLFFVLEKLLLWRHCHTDECEAHGSEVAAHHDQGRSAMMVMVGDTVHNFVDGIVIAGAFLVDVQIGIVTSLAMIAHEIPQEVGDFLILLYSGYSKARALLFNLVSSLATLIGALLGYFMLQTVQGLLTPLMGLAAASLIYVAMSDLIPGLHKRPELSATLQQIALISLGVFSIWAVHSLLENV